MNMLRKILLISIAFLVLSGNTIAAENILFSYSGPANEAQPLVETYRGKNDVNYSFATPNANISFSDGSNNSFWMMRQDITILNDVTLNPEVGWNPFTRPIIQIADSVHISADVDGTQIGVNFIYQRLNIVPVTWQAIYEVYVDGQIVCTVDSNDDGFSPFNSNTWGGSLKFPEPYLRFTWSVQNLSVLEDYQQPQEWNYTNAGHALTLRFGDTAWGPMAKYCKTDDITFERVLSSYPTVNINHKQDRLYDHEVGFLAMNKTARMQESIRISEAFGDGIFEESKCDGFRVLLACVSPVGIIEQVMKWISGVTALFFAIIPFGETISRFFSVVFSPIADAIILLSVIFFDTTHGLGSVYFVLITWAAAWGAAFWSITGNFYAIFTWPFIVTKGITIGVYQLAKFFLWTLPRQSIRWILDLIPG